MAGIYLTDAAEWLRAVVPLVEYPGWQYRAKSSGGYADASRPWGVMLHHTAGNTDGEGDADYMAEGADAAPIANVSVDHDGTVRLLAAGPTNTNGTGSGVTWSKGTVPTDSMNSYAWGVELCNNGVGGEYPEAQLDSAFAVANCINAHLGNQPSDVALHFTWAPDRKIDPARYDAVLGPWQPAGVNSSGTWSVDDVRAECLRRAGTTPAPPSGDDDMLLYVEVSDAWSRFVATGQAEPELALWQVGYVSDAGGNPRATVYANTLRHVSVSKAQLSGCTLIGDPPPADDGGSGLATWATTDFYEHIPKGG